MPIIKSAKKALRGSKQKRVFNLRRKKAMNSSIKEYKKLLVTKDIEKAKDMLPKIQQVLDKAAKRGVIKRNNASRKKSRLMKKVS